MKGVAAAVLLTACATDGHVDGGTSRDLCARAQDKLRQCGEVDAAEAFAADCDEDTARDLVELDCSAASSKSDGLGCFIDGCPEEFDDPIESFAYGSIDNDTTLAGVPFWIFTTLPDVCPNLLPPGGLESIGVMFEEGRDRPVGWSKRQLAVSSRVGMNCAFCHTSTVRTAPERPRQLHFGGSSQSLDAEAMMRLLIDCMASEAFTADAVLDAVDERLAESGEELGFVEQTTLRVFVTAGQHLARQEQSSTQGLFDKVPWGPGRADPFNIIKSQILGLDLTAEPEIGVEKIPVIWNGTIRRERGLPGHWDGTIGSWDERNLAAALALRAAEISDQLADRITAWTEPLVPPPFPFAIDDELAAHGEAVYLDECASCHDLDPAVGTRLGTVIPLDEIGTDPERSLLFDAGFEESMNTEIADYEFSSWKDTDGYVAAPIDGAWLRAPFLHNGSVPTLQALLEPARERPTEFFKGYDVYDEDALGFITDVAREGQREFFSFDTSRPGNRNTGHEFGVDRSAPDKRALLEYLKTL